LQINVRILRKK